MIGDLSKVKKAKANVTWRHASAGQIREALCRGHEREVEAALTLLSIAWATTGMTINAPCDRCQKEARPLPVKDRGKS